MCRRFTRFGIIEAMLDAIKDSDREIMESITFLIEQGGEDADAFYAHIEGHPDVALIRQEVPQLFA